MKYSLTFASIVVLTGASYSQAEDVLPPRFNFDRYAKMVERSPFAVATEAAQPAATPDFAKDLYIANAAHSPEGDMVTLASTADHNFKKYLTTREPVDGYSIANIEWSDRVGETKVTISKDGNFATLTFNQALLHQSGPNAASAPRTFTPPAPGMVPSAPSMPNPALSKLPAEVQKLIPPAQSPRARTRALIQRSPRGAARTPSQSAAAKQ
jgi:hypothetical protein